ncbi:bifunctional UDP-N-acetylmuramoyl-tripeptide:D-alanyl-D-alanine ligase/alanine racemase [Tenuifilaceae bacterium CYCD]|nr:bifunctional UDP-N-acetylmuramoyl-tripeptide:D-alanyl-D-alanine ligase/alanine racemase [Tenuifilaceae bacterium CYCD]
MLHFTASEIAQIVNAKLIGNPNTKVSHLTIDSRTPSGGNGTLFAAIVGQHHDGHKFIGDLYNFQNVRVFLVSKTETFSDLYPDATFIVCSNTLEALQKLAAFHRNQFNYPVVGITGSNGKTIVKEWLNQLLSGDYRIVRSPKSFNSQVGVPLSVLQMDQNFHLGVFEAGISMVGEMDKLQPIINPEIGIFTNIGLPHQENFTGIAQKVTEKLKLFKSTKQLVYCSDHTDVDNEIKLQIDKSKTQLFTWGYNPNANVRVKKIEVDDKSSKISIDYKNTPFTFSIPFSDKASIENAMHCLCLMLILNIDFKTIEQRMAKLTQVAMRLELKEGINNCSIINDSYNSDIGSLKVALDFLVQQKQHSNRILILSDIMQSGLKPETLYSEVASLVKEKGISKIIGIGTEISKFQNLFLVDKEFYDDTTEFLQNFSRRQISNSAILIKGSRSFHFERISAILEQKSHRTVLEVNINSLVHNLNFYRSKLKPNVKLMAMVKAFSYGSGSFEIANLLQFHRVDYLGVAFADEGVALREAGISLPIIVLNPSFGTYELMIEYELEPEIYSFTGLKEFIAAIDRMGVSSYSIHIKIDSGMHRLGFTPDQIPELVAMLQQSKMIKVKSIFSHLAASDETEHDKFTQHQIDTFANACSQIAQSIGYTPIRHILNTGGIERYPNAQFDMVRLGIGLYGISSTQQEKLLPVSTLKSRVIQVKHINEGETVGYSRKGKVTHPTTVIAIPIGYADGLNRKLGNGVGKVLVKGKLAPIIGNISMDTCTIDATGIDIAEGDEVTIFGANPTIYDVAKALETIPYEVLTSISRRVKRIYYQE